VQQFHRPADALGGLLEHAPLIKTSPQAEGSQDKTAPLKEELFPPSPVFLLPIPISTVVHLTAFEHQHIIGFLGSSVLPLFFLCSSSVLLFSNNCLGTAQGQEQGKRKG
jgi:hypothetical protein